MSSEELRPVEPKDRQEKIQKNTIFWKCFTFLEEFTYRHEPMGALPIGHYSLMNLERLNVQEEVSNTYDSMLHVYPTKDMDYSIFTDDEKESLNLVIEKFKNYKANEIVDYMHEEKAYTETKAGEIIPFSLAKQIRAL